MEMAVSHNIHALTRTPAADATVRSTLIRKRNWNRWVSRLVCHSSVGCSLSHAVFLVYVARNLTLLSSQYIRYQKCV